MPKVMYTQANLSSAVFAWYTHYNLPATPINPSSPSITVSSKPHDTLPSISSLPNPTQTAVSIITPPKVTQKVLEEAKSLGIKAVWLQPGTFDENVWEFASSNFETAVGGDGGRGSEGWCVLVDGERAAKAAGRKLKL